MKFRWKITVGIVALVIACAVLFSRSPNREQKALEETRRALRQQGFKTDLSDFHFSSSDEMRARAAVLGITTRAELTNHSRPEPVVRIPAGVNEQREAAEVCHDIVGHGYFKGDNLRLRTNDDLLEHEQF